MGQKKKKNSSSSSSGGFLLCLEALCGAMAHIVAGILPLLKIKSRKKCCHQFFFSSVARPAKRFIKLTIPLTEISIISCASLIPTFLTFFKKRSTRINAQSFLFLTYLTNLWPQTQIIASTVFIH